MKALSESGRVFWRKYSARKVLRQIIADNNLNSAAYSTGSVKKFVS